MGLYLFDQDIEVVKQMWLDVFEAGITTNGYLSEIWPPPSSSSPQTKTTETHSRRVATNSSSGGGGGQSRGREIELALRYFDEKYRPLRMLMEKTPKRSSIVVDEVGQDLTIYTDQLTKELRLTSATTTDNTMSNSTNITTIKEEEDEKKPTPEFLFECLQLGLSSSGGDGGGVGGGGDDGGGGGDGSGGGGGGLASVLLNFDPCHGRDELQCSRWTGQAAAVAFSPDCKVEEEEEEGGGEDRENQGKTEQQHQQQQQQQHQQPVRSHVGYSIDDKQLYGRLLRQQGNIDKLFLGDTKCSIWTPTSNITTPSSYKQKPERVGVNVGPMKGGTSCSRLLNASTVPGVWCRDHSGGSTDAIGRGVAGGGGGSGTNDIGRCGGGGSTNAIGRGVAGGGGGRSVGNSCGVNGSSGSSSSSGGGGGSSGNNPFIKHRSNLGKDFAKSRVIYSSSPEPLERKKVKLKRKNGVVQEAKQYMEVSLDNLRNYLYVTPSSSFDFLRSCHNSFQKLKYLRIKERESPMVRLSCAFQQGYYLELLFPNRKIIQNNSGNNINITNMYKISTTTNNNNNNNKTTTATINPNITTNISAANNTTTTNTNPTFKYPYTSITNPNPNSNIINSNPNNPKSATTNRNSHSTTTSNTNTTTNRNSHSTTTSNTNTTTNLNGTITNSNPNKNNDHYKQYLLDLNMSLSYSRQLRQFYKSFRCYRRLLHLNVPLRSILRNISRIREKIEGSQWEESFWSTLPSTALRAFYECYGHWFGLALYDIYTLFDVVDNYPSGTAEQFLADNCARVYECEGHMKAISWLNNSAEGQRYLLAYRTLDYEHCVLATRKDGHGWTYEESFDKDRDSIVHVGLYVCIKSH